MATNGLLNGLATELADLIGHEFLPAILTRMIPGNGPAHNPGAGTPDPYQCLAIVEDYSAEAEPIQSLDRKVLVLAASIGIEPKPGDYFKIMDKTGTVLRVMSDPAVATFELRVKF